MYWLVFNIGFYQCNSYLGIMEGGESLFSQTRIIINMVSVSMLNGARGEGWKVIGYKPLSQADKALAAKMRREVERDIHAVRRK